MKKTSIILNEVLGKIKPSKEELELIEDSLGNFLERLGKKLKVLKVKAEVFVGGSFAKGSVIKKDYYDVDVFVRFDRRYKNEEISNLVGRGLRGLKNVVLIHGSRDYFRIKLSEGLFIELIPVFKIKNPKEAENITDLSYSHVSYIKRKIKNKKILDEIRIAKAFCHASQCYGAESYINGFSGYGLELLGYYYGGFLKFIRAVSKIDEKIVIDIERDYKNKNQVLMDVNASKLGSPIVLIDPTYKQRNVLAALSDETFERFQKACRGFLKNPSLKAFESKKTDLEKIKKDAEKKKLEFVLIEVKTDKQEGDIAGSKLLKFYKHFGEEINLFFDVKKKGFNYNGRKSARYFFVVKSRGEIVVNGPSVNDLENVKAFEKRHRVYFTKKGRIYAKEKVGFSLRGFVKGWVKKNKKRMGEMSVKGLKII